MKSIPDFQKRKAAGKAIAVVTCYDAATANALAGTSVDALLVGDTCAMVVHGFDSTVHATVEMIATHVAAVRRGAPGKVIIADLPFLSNRGSLDRAVDATLSLMRAGANAIKLERCAGNLDLVRHLVDSGAPVMGHLGLTPQSVNEFGGFKMQAKTEPEAERLLQEAKQLEAAGCFSIVLECVPARVARRVTEALRIPTIGIGSGPQTSGQVLVINDLLGLDPAFQPKFVRRYADFHNDIKRAVEAYCADTLAGSFPGEGEFTA